MTSDGLALAFERSATQLVVHLIGDLDLASAPRLVADVLANRQGEAEVLLDASALHFCDAAGVHALVVTARQLADAGCETVIRRPSEHLMRILDLIDLRTIIDLRTMVDLRTTGDPAPAERSPATVVAPDDRASGPR